jgi:hypothetical protein
LEINNFKIGMKAHIIKFILQRLTGSQYGFLPFITVILALALNRDRTEAQVLSPYIPHMYPLGGYVTELAEATDCQSSRAETKGGMSLTKNVICKMIKALT